MKGFKYTINGRTYLVHFKHFNNVRIKCHLYDTDIQRIFTGIAKLNKDAGDIYDEKLGEEIAFRKALEKRDIAFDKMIKHIEEDLSIQQILDKIAIQSKFVKERQKIESQKVVQ